MVNTRQFSVSTYMQDMTKSHTFSAKNQGSTYTPRNTVFTNTNKDNNDDNLVISFS